MLVIFIGRINKAFLRAKAATTSVCLSVCHTGGSVKNGAS